MRRSLRLERRLLNFIQGTRRGALCFLFSLGSAASGERFQVTPGNDVGLVDIYKNFQARKRIALLDKKIKAACSQQAGKEPEDSPAIEDRDEVLTTYEACQLLRVSRPTLYRLAQEKKVPAVKVGKSWRFTRNGLLNYVRTAQF